MHEFAKVHLNRTSLLRPPLFFSVSQPHTYTVAAAAPEAGWDKPQKNIKSPFSLSLQALKWAIHSAVQILFSFFPRSLKFGTEKPSLSPESSCYLRHLLLSFYVYQRR